MKLRRLFWSQLESRWNLEADIVDICYPPIFQSGGKFDLEPSASSNDDDLCYDSASVIICALGSRCNAYCANVARTFFIDSDATQSKAYDVLLKAHEAAVGALKPGNKACAVYKAAYKVVMAEAPEFISNLTKSAGLGIGLEFHESGMSLSEKNEKILKAGMVLNVSLGFQNMQTKSSKAKSQNYALLLADTVTITPSGHEVVTSLSSKAFEDVFFNRKIRQYYRKKKKMRPNSPTDVAYPFKDGEEEEDERPQVSVKNKRTETYSKAILRSDNHGTSKQELRRQRHTELARQKREEIAKRLAGVENATGDGRSSSRTSNDLIAYRSVNDLPSPRDMMIQVDERNEAILIPLYGSMVPFHVATVKTVSSQAVTTGNCYLSIIFNVPGTRFSSHDPSSLKNQADIFLKEVFFCSKDLRYISELEQQIKKLKRDVISKESKRAEGASLVTQEKLVLAGKTKLYGPHIRPSFGSSRKNLIGTLEAHDNGFRYSRPGEVEYVDILFGNIKHAFFQAAEKEEITLLHFHLHNHIMVGDNKTKDVQFRMKVMDECGNRSFFDVDETEEERREREHKIMIEMDFQNFVNRVNDLWGQLKSKGIDLKFEQPLRQFGFKS